jgi:hypothetical protein
VEELARALALVADDRLALGLQAREAEAAEHLADRRGWPLEDGGGDERACLRA